MGALHDGRWLNWQYVWRDRRSGTKVLFIDKEMKDGLFAARRRHRGPRQAGRTASAASSWRWRARRWCTHATCSSTATTPTRRAATAGSMAATDTRAAPTTSATRRCWRGWPRTPGCEVVTTDDLTDDDVVGELDLLRASDPYIEEQWRLPRDPVRAGPRQRAGLRHLVRRVGRDARGLARRDAARRLRPGRAGDRAGQGGRPRRRRDELLLLARLYWLMCLHESQWSKRPRIEPGQRGVRPLRELRRGRVAAAAQRPRLPRGARVGAVGPQRWPRGAPRRRPGGARSRVAGGPGGSPPPWSRAEYAGLQWDHDPLPNVVLYNERRAGGARPQRRAGHAPVRDGRAAARSR